MAPNRARSPASSPDFCTEVCREHKIDIDIGRPGGPKTAKMPMYSKTDRLVLSETAGTFGSIGLRLGLVTAIARTLLPLICGMDTIV